MAEVTAIEWTDATFNPWWGCERVSPACAHCYADSLARRWGMRLWDSGEFRELSEANWRHPVAWNVQARAASRPMFVFCASMADVFQDHPRLLHWRERLWDLIEATPWLTWLLLTKRPENIPAMLRWPRAPLNVWLGTSIENARHSFRADLLRQVEAPVHFLSCEPLLGSLFDSRGRRTPLDLADIEWVIAGGESGPGFRPMNLDHARELRDACVREGVAYFLKQIGGRTPKAGGKELDGRVWLERPDPWVPSEAGVLFR